MMHIIMHLMLHLIMALHNALLTELNAEGSQLLFKGVPVNEQILSTAPVFVQGGRQLTLSQLNNLPRTAPRQESAADIQTKIEEQRNFTEEDLINSYKKTPLIKRGSFLCLINNQVVNREITLLFIQKFGLWRMCG